MGPSFVIVFATWRNIFAGVDQIGRENSTNESVEVNVEARNLFYNEMCFEMPGIYSQPILESLGRLSAVMKVALISLSLGCLN